MNVNANGFLIQLFSCVPIPWQVCIRALATDATVRLLWKDKSNSVCSTITSRAHWKFMWRNARIWQRSTQNVTEAIHMWRYVNAWETHMSDIWWTYFRNLYIIYVRLIRVGVFVAGQIKEWQTQNKSQKAHTESGVRWNDQVLHVAEQSRVENTLADRMAFGYVWSQRFLGRSDYQFTRESIRQPTTAMVFTSRTSKHQQSSAIWYVILILFSNFFLHCLFTCECRANHSMT